MEQVSTAFKIDASKGQRDMAVSSQWWNRPADQRFLSLNDLAKHVNARSELACQSVVDVSNIRVHAERDDPESLSLEFGDTRVTPTHWSFGQLAGLSGAPTGYLRKLPAPLAGVNLQYGLSNLRSENAKLYYTDSELIAATGPEYGRVFDSEVVSAVQRIAGNGTGDTNWKVPGAIDWSNGTYNPFVNISTDTTTLYASDRDVFMFLVDDTHPIEIGKLQNGDPDLVFRGFYVWNSEVGSKTLGVSTFLLRGVCQNRCLWGVQDKQSMTIRHSKNAPYRFAAEVGPALNEYSNSSTYGVLDGINKAKSIRVAKTEDDQLKFLSDRGFSARDSRRIIDSVLGEEHKAPESVWDFVQGITAVARSIKHTDDRVAMERKAGDMMAKAAR